MNRVLLNKIKLPAFLLAVLVLPMLFGHLVPVEVKSWSYALSLSMKSILEFVLPFIIFSFVFSCLANQQKGAVLFVFLLIACVFISNFTALLVGYSAGNLGLELLNMQTTPAPSMIHLQPAWTFTLKKLISNDRALLLGFMTGIFFSLMPSRKAKQVANQLNLYSNAFLKRLFIPLLPLFIIGFIFKLEFDNVLQTSLKIYGPVLLLIIITQWVYLTLWYSIGSAFQPKRLFQYLRNVLPATLTGLSTISSAASMPVLLVATEKNLGDSDRARMLVPAIINIHTVGSAIGVPILALATLASFGYPIPSLSSFMVFAFFTALAKYAVAAVPGGVIIVVAPLLETYLGFSSDMIGLITAVYLICDPFGTCANVTGNGIFPILFSRLYNKLSRQPQYDDASVAEVA
ncbi:cation:dicarboxylase symporter family transporter [Legionella sp. W05-934-2]|jgi:Na+/H+-dicarboxylate symporter|uniref:cation:dicarboxylate symporter family transporter n=1 Tax=Legionella sp. W05-934-2 TaxID=1198649 RepID=UPI0034638448